jgi:hypothetical protein
MTKRRAISPQEWFYLFKTNLQNRHQDVRRRLAGAAAEQWLNVEFFCWLQEALRLSGLPYVTYNEFGKTDLAVFRVDTSIDGPRVQWDPIAVMEAKALYSAYDDYQIRTKLGGLLDQLECRRKAFPKARVFGFIYGIFAYWHGEKHNEETFYEYRQTIKEQFRRVAKGRASLAKPCMELVLDDADLRLAAGAKAHVGMCAQRVQLSKA